MAAVRKRSLPTVTPERRPQTRGNSALFLVAEIEARGTEAFDPGIVLKSGARLVREWAGQMHTVMVLENGFDYGGERYPSLSKIASRITGAHWSGPCFFGIRKTTSRPAVAARAGHE